MIAAFSIQLKAISKNSERQMRQRKKPHAVHHNIKQTTLQFSPNSKQRPQPRSVGESSTPIPPSIPRKRETKARVCETAYGSSSEDINAVQFESSAPKTIILNSSEEEVDRDVIPSPPNFLKKQKTRVESTDSEEDVRPRAPKFQALSRQHPDTEEENDLEDEIPTPRRRLLKRRKVSESNNSNSDHDQNLSDEVDKERIIETRFRDRGKKSAFQSNLEKLRRRKRGQPEESDKDNDRSEEGEGNILNVFEGATPHKAHDSVSGSGEDEGLTDSDDFIVEDEGITAPSLPPQFSMNSYEDLSHQFKKIFQFFVHIAVQPPRKRHKFMEKNLREEDYFSVPLQITRRKLSGLRDSLVASSVWRPEFRKALEFFPEFNLVALDFAMPSCDACHLGRRISTLNGRLSGLGYDKLGFENIQIGCDSEYEDEALPQEFHLGRFCARRTQVYHQFSHWEYELFRVISCEIQELHLSKNAGTTNRQFFKVAFAGGKKPPEDLTDADELCEWLDERQIIEMEWKKVNAMMEKARHLEIATKRGEVDN